jgi:thioredoxin reductase
MKEKKRALSGIQNNIETIILGGGPAGLACAFELNKANKNFLVFEKN